MTQYSLHFIQKIVYTSQKSVYKTQKIGDSAQISLSATQIAVHWWSVCYKYQQYEIWHQYVFFFLPCLPHFYCLAMNQLEHDIWVGQLVGRFQHKCQNKQLSFPNTEEIKKMTTKMKMNLKIKMTPKCYLNLIGKITPFTARAISFLARAISLNFEQSSWITLKIGNQYASFLFSKSQKFNVQNTTRMTVLTDFCPIFPCAHFLTSIHKS